MDAKPKGHFQSHQTRVTVLSLRDLDLSPWAHSSKKIGWEEKSFEKIIPSTARSEWRRASEDRTLGAADWNEDGGRRTTNGDRTMTGWTL